MKKEISFEKNYLTVADIKSYLCISTTAAYNSPIGRTSLSVGLDLPSEFLPSYFSRGLKSILMSRPIWLLQTKR